MQENRPVNQPLDLDATLALASRLNADCQYDEADALMLGAIEQHAGAAQAFAHYVDLADKRGDFLGTVERAQEMRQRFPNHVYGYLGAAEGLRILRRFNQAETFVEEGLRRFPRVGGFLLEAMRLAEARGDWKGAAARTQAFRDLRDGDAWSWYQSVRSLIRGGRMDLADDLLTQALELWPDDEDLRELHGSVAEGLAQFEEADRRWREAMDKFPANADIALGHALVWGNPPGPMRRLRNWPEVFERLQRLHDRLPDCAMAYSTHARLLHENERLDEAETLARQAHARFPHDTAVAVRFARVLQAQGRVDAAVQMLTGAVAAIPNDAHIHAELAVTLADAGQLDAAEGVCTAAAARFRYHPRPLIEYAAIAMRREHYETALQRWIDGAERFPYHDAFQWGVEKARMALIGRGQERMAGDILADGPVADRGGSIRQLLLGFESLGGPGLACEFAVVQRRAGADPLGLLRWTDLSIQMLREALAARFDGVGTPEQTDLVLVSDNRMYNLVDRRFAMQTHTFIREDAMPRDQVFEESCRRLAYLKGKLLRDLQAAKKIFVFRLGDEDVDHGEIEGLFAELRTFGEVTLLCVARADARHPKGTVDLVRPGLLMGYVQELQALGLTETATWQEVCRLARDLALQSSAALAPAA